ncbi:MAG: hypothetical protein AAGG79_06325, partial [Pseudomonadota bacterium]
MDRALVRLRRAAPFGASLAFNLALIVALALGYTSFIARGVVGAGIGEQVVSVTLLERLPEAEPAQEVQAEEPEEAPEEAEVGADALPEGNAVEDGNQDGQATGDEPPEQELGQDIAVAKAGVDVPQIALPEVDAGEGRPDGVIGVDCYRVFSDDANKA